MTESRFKTLRHIETVRNFLSVVIKDLVDRSVKHDQSKLEEPEVSVFDEYTPKLRDLEYGSEEYKKCVQEMSVAVEHHYSVNDHHPEFFNNMDEMNLIQLIEMLCDWIAAGKRHESGDIFKSIEINQERFGYPDFFKHILENTARFLLENEPYHKAEES